MKELIEKVVAFVPEYLLSLGGLLARPKTFLANKVPDSEAAYRDSLLFLAVSVCIFVVALAPISPAKSDPWQRVGAVAVVEALTVSLMAGALRLAWRIVGGKARIRTFFTIYSYIAAVALLVMALTLLVAEGTFKVFDPALYLAVREAVATGKPVPKEAAQSRVLYATLGIYAAGFVGLSVWSLSSWGAFRQINNASRARSVCALYLAGLLSCPVALTVFLVGRALGGQ